MFTQEKKWFCMTFFLTSWWAILLKDSQWYWELTELAEYPERLRYSTSTFLSDESCIHCSVSLYFIRTCHMCSLFKCKFKLPSVVSLWAKFQKYSSALHKTASWSKQGRCFMELSPLKAMLMFARELPYSKRIILVILWPSLYVFPFSKKSYLDLLQW